MANPYDQTAALAGAFADIGKQLFQGQNAYEAGRMKAAQAAAQQEMIGSHARLYNAQAQKAAAEAEALNRRQQYRTPEFSGKIAAALAGLSEGQGSELAQFQQTGGWGMTPERPLPMDQSGPPVPPMPKSAPAWYKPEIEQRYNMARGAQLANLGATGDSKADDTVKAFAELLGQGRIDSAIANPAMAANLGRAMAANKGAALFHQGANGVMDNFTGAEVLNEVGKTAAQENRAQANSANASAAERIAQRDLTRSKVGHGQTVMTPDGTVITTGKPTKLSATAEKELFEADDVAQSAKSTVGLLKQALELNDKAYSGYFAKPRATLASNVLPSGKAADADATILLDNIMTTQALESLKSTFGAAPTEGERKILMEIQASADKTPAQRKAIINKAISAAERRTIAATNKANALRSGTYNMADPQRQQSGDPIDDLLKKYGN